MRIRHRRSRVSFFNEGFHAFVINLDPPMKQTLLLLTLVVFAATPACEKKPETPGENVKEAVEDARDAVKDAAKDAKDSITE